MKRILMFVIIFCMCANMLCLGYAVDFNLPRAVAKYEHEPNNSIYHAQKIYQDDSIYGTIKSENDVDYYKIDLYQTGKINKTINLENMSEKEKKNIIAYYLGRHPEGICGMFYRNENDSHMIVFTNTTYESDSFIKSRLFLNTKVDRKYFDFKNNNNIYDENSFSRSYMSDSSKFTVYDPAVKYHANIELSNSWAGRRYSWYNLKYICMVND